jgi:hypothetical protein
MKALYKFLFIGLVAGVTLASCSKEDLETAPTTSMSGASLMTNANAALVPLNGIIRSMYTAGWSTSGNVDQCFGISAHALCADLMGEDMIMSDMGNGWFWYDCVYNDKNFFARTDWRNYDLWNAFYTWISNANYILAAEETMEGAAADKNYVLGQAYVIRAYSYFMMAQYFARTYKGHENEPCGPIYTEPTTPETQGQPRATVAEVYAQITSDIQKGVSLLSTAHARTDKSHIGYDVALGIQARIALVMEDWQTALSAAKAAMDATTATPVTVDAFAGLNSTDAKNVMWGADIITDQVGMFASLFTHMDADAGEYGAAALKQINKELYAKMNPTDARACHLAADGSYESGWWNTAYTENGNDEIGGIQQEKFKFLDQQTWTGDYIWMRYEEMLLTAAEAACRMGDEASAKNYLNTLMKYRDPAYDCSKKTGTELGALTDEWTGSLLEEILIQRRLELWGEFGRVYDIRRLKQGFVRTSAMGWPSDAQLTGRPTNDPENYMWVLSIPQSEFDGNINMSGDKDQNPLGDK